MGLRGRELRPRRPMRACKQQLAHAQVARRCGACEWRVQRGVQLQGGAGDAGGPGARATPEAGRPGWVMSEGIPGRLLRLWLAAMAASHQGQQVAARMREASSGGVGEGCTGAAVVLQEQVRHGAGALLEHLSHACDKARTHTRLCVHTCVLALTGSCECYLHCS